MLINIVQLDRPQMRLECWIPNATNTHSEYVINTYCFSTATLVTRTRLTVRTLLVFGAIALSGPGPSHSRGFCITHSDALQSVGVLWTSDKLVQRPLPDNTQHSQ